MRISVENVCRNYGGKPVLDHVTLPITEKSRIGLIGVNGTGKSTLLRLIAAVLLPCFPAYRSHIFRRRPKA